MAVKIGELLKSLATKLKLDTENEPLKPLFALEAEVDDETAGAFEQKLMTEEAAIANKAIRDKIRGEAFNGMDAVLEEIMADGEFDDTLKAEAKKQDTIFKRSKYVAAKLKELTQKKAEAKTPLDKKAIQDEMAKITQQFTTFKTKAPSDLAAEQASNAAKIYNMALAFKLQGKNYYHAGTEGAIPPQVHATTAQTLLMRQLAADGAELVYDEPSQTFKLINKETKLDFHDRNNRKLTADEYIDGVLAENKLLKTAKPGDPVPTNPKPPIITPGPEPSKAIAGMNEVIDQQLSGAG